MKHIALEVRSDLYCILCGCVGMQCVTEYIQEQVRYIFPVFNDILILLYHLAVVARLPRHLCSLILQTYLRPGPLAEWVARWHQ